MSTVKDRDGMEMAGQPFGDFGVDYLVNVAGWKRKPASDESIVRVG